MKRILPHGLGRAADGQKVAERAEFFDVDCPEMFRRACRAGQGAAVTDRFQNAVVRLLP